MADKDDQAPGTGMLGHPPRGWEIVDSSAQTVPVRVRFGKRPDQLLDIAWAEAILTTMAEKYTHLFGKLLAEAMLGPGASTASRGRPPA